MTRQWIHLDLKGMIPDEPRLLEWLTWLRGLGFEGVVLEYEDRLPWDTWPGTFRAGFDLDAWRRVWGHCRRLGVEVIPLIQTFGHLEWLLKHDRYAGLREAGYWNLLCPQHQDVLPQLRAWVDEVIRLHHDGRYIHVGLDEVHHLASCPRCVAAGSDGGPLKVFLDHARAVLEYVRSRGRTPIMWADMVFQPREQRNVIDQLPDGVAICDWRYGGEVAAESVVRPGGGRIAMGASAIRSGFEPPHGLMADLGHRLENIGQWHRVVDRAPGALAALIHTTWGRSRSLMPLYGPWEGWLPAFIAAGRRGAAISPALAAGMDLLQRTRHPTGSKATREAAAAMADLSSDDPLERQALRWWEIALRHRHELWWAERPLTIGYEGLLAVQRHVGLDPDIIQLRRGERAGVIERLGVLAADIRAFCRDNRWSDADELVESRVDNVIRHLQRRPM